MALPRWPLGTRLLRLAKRVLLVKSLVLYVITESRRQNHPLGRVKMNASTHRSQLPLHNSIRVSSKSLGSIRRVSQDQDQFQIDGNPRGVAPSGSPTKRQPHQAAQALISLRFGYMQSIQQLIRICDGTLQLVRKKNANWKHTPPSTSPQWKSK